MVRVPAFVAGGLFALFPVGAYAGYGVLPSPTFFCQQAVMKNGRIGLFLKAAWEEISWNKN